MQFYGGCVGQHRQLDTEGGSSCRVLDTETIDAPGLIFLCPGRGFERAAIW
jgi:hypothetical protein